MSVQCIATKPLLTTTRRCPRPATHGEWCRQHAESLGGWRLAPPGADHADCHGHCACYFRGQDAAHSWRTAAGEGR